MFQPRRFQITTSKCLDSQTDLQSVHNDPRNITCFGMTNLLTDQDLLNRGRAEQHDVAALYGTSLGHPSSTVLGTRRSHRPDPFPS